MFLCLTYVILTTTTSSTNYRQVTRYCYYYAIAAFQNFIAKKFNCKKYIFIYNARAARSGSFNLANLIDYFLYY